LIFSLLLTLEKEKCLNLSRHVLPSLSPMRTDLSSPVHGVVKKRYGHIRVSNYLSNRTVYPFFWGGGRAGFCFSIFLASMGPIKDTRVPHKFHRVK